MLETAELAQILLTFGGLFLLGLVADLLGRHTPLPRVTLLILAGILIGPEGINWLPDFSNSWFPVLTNIALAMIGFELGKNLTRSQLKRLGRPILGISLGVMLMTALLIFSGMLWLGAPIELALIFAAIAPATAPAPVMDVVNEVHAKGDYTNTLLGIVAIDDAWGMLLFSTLLVLATLLSTESLSLAVLTNGLWELGGALLLGLLLGFPMAYLSQHLYPGKSTQAEVLGLVLLCAGAAIYLEVSYLLAAMVMGTVVANFSQGHKPRAFAELEAIQWPLMILFFLLAGASLPLNALWQAGALGAGYVLLRFLGRISGSWLGAHWAGSRNPHDYWMGLAMLPHAGLPIGMALIAAQQFPHYQTTLLAVILGATVLFELIGPALTRHSLRQAGEAKFFAQR
ncbi:MAG: cation:proton antiporter [Thiotrichales bacterium]|nr:cation:proton antiporter [Thiotrichales bacterium]